MTRLQGVRRILAGGACAFAVAIATGAAAQDRQFNIPAGDLKAALDAYIAQTGDQLIFRPEDVAGRRTQGVSGKVSPADALGRILAGTGLSVHRDASGAEVITRPVPLPRGASDEVSTVEEVVVTAQKRTERLSDVPMAVSAISGDRLTKTQSTTLQDIVDKTPGMQLISAGPTENELVIRGLSVAAGINSSVATYVDEVPYTSEGPFAGSANLAPNFDTYDLARVEVLKGPQGTLYGANALGGLLKYVTNPPDSTHFSASVLAGASTVEHGGDGDEIHGMVNLPLGDAAALRIVANDTYFPGYIDDPSRGAKDINAIRRYGARGSLLWRPSPDLSIRLNADYQYLRGDDMNTEDLTAATLKPLYGDLTQERVIGQPQQMTTEIYNATVNWRLGIGTLTNSTSYSHTDPKSLQDLSYIYQPILESVFGGHLGAVVPTSEPVNSFTQELRLTSNKQRLEWTVGAYFNDEAADEHQPLDPINLDTHQILTNFQPALGTYHIKSTYEEYAAFADATYHFTSAFEVGLGGRYSSNSQTYHQINDGLFSGSDNFRTTSKQDVFTYSADAKYRFDPHAMAYARIATGFVPGGPNDVLPGSPLPLTYRSSSTTNYELGFKGDALHGQISYDFDVFDVEWQDIQLGAVINNLYSITNGGTARSRGVEGDLSFTPAKGLTLALNGAYTDARLTEDTPASFGGVAGDRLPLSPYFAGTFSAEYERPIEGEISGFGGVDWHYSGDRMSEFEFGSPRQDLPGYSMVNLRAGLKYKTYTLTAYVKNVGDVRAISSVSPETLNGVSALGAVVATPRTVGVTLAASF